MKIAVAMMFGLILLCSGCAVDGQDQSQASNVPDKNAVMAQPAEANSTVEPLGQGDKAKAATFGEGISEQTPAAFCNYYCTGDNSACEPNAPNPCFGSGSCVERCI